jgi:uncharacterized protein
MVPELLSPLKIVVDELRLQNKEKANGKYLLTGSASILALSRFTDALVDQMTVLTLYPFSASEAIMGKGDFLDRLFNMNF